MRVGQEMVKKASRCNAHTDDSNISRGKSGVKIQRMQMIRGETPSKRHMIIRSPELHRSS